MKTLDGSNMFIFDIEADGLLEEMTKVHCLSVLNLKTGIITSYTEPELIKQFFEYNQNNWFIGHNIVTYDFPALKKIYGIEPPEKLIDTLALSWVLEDHRKNHGLDSWGETVGVEKPKISDWKSLSIQDYIHRCTEDVRINYLVWKREYALLTSLYENDEQKMWEYIVYITQKMKDCQEQQEMGLKFDREYCEESLEKLKAIREEKLNALKEVMPMVPVKSKKAPPKAMYKADGSLSLIGIKWKEFLIANSYPDTYMEEVSYISGYKEPNPGSHAQLKNWLFSLGWIPQNYKFERDEETKETREIPQIGSPEGNGEICPSVKKLFEKEPALENLDSLFVVSHRIGVLKKFLVDEKDGRLYQGIAGLTNTLRWQHSVLVNMPKPDKKYGENIRGCLISDDGCLFIGADLVAIEDKTKQHYIYKYDPEYVKEMQTPGYDPHLVIAVKAGLLTEEQKEEHISGVKKYSDQRQKAKVVNYSATYKVGALKLSKQLDIPLKQAKKILEAYWDKNKAILDVEESLEIKEVWDKRWLKNPISGFWYRLRADKDKFSTLNQGIGVYVMDLWIKEMKKLGLKIPYQYHDEILKNCPSEKIEEETNLILLAMEEVNKKLSLNVKLNCSVQVAQKYSNCH